MTKERKNKLICKSVLFNSPYDEDAFFEWIKKIKCITSFDGRGDELYLYFKSKRISKRDIYELFGLFERYKINKKQLKVFENESNKFWFEVYKL